MMKALPHHLEWLESRLIILDVDGSAMSPAELDGLVAGLVVCPEAIAPTEWLPVAFGNLAVVDAADDGIALQDCIRLALAHRDAVDSMLRNARGSYSPVFDADPGCGEILWELWADGFGRAMALRPDPWRALAAGLAQDPVDAEAAWSLAGISALIAVATYDDLTDLGAPAIAALTEAAPALIPGWVEALYGWGRRQAPRVGRCRCGSERPYAACCGLN